MLTHAFNACALIPAILRLPMTAATRIFWGSLVALDANNAAVAATDTAGLKVQGVCVGGAGFPRNSEAVDNSTGSAGQVGVDVRGGIFRLQNSTAAPLAAADLGKLAVVEDEITVAKASAHRVAAGVLVALEPGYVWLRIMPPAGYPNPAFQTFDLSLPAA